MALEFKPEHFAAAFSLGFIISGIFIFITAYYLMPANSKMYQERKSKLVIVSLIGCIIVLLVTIIKLCTYFVFTDIEEDYDILLFGAIIGWTLIISAYLSRTYLLLYQHKYNQVISDKFWMIPLHKESFEHNFWIRNIKKFGNEKWLIKYLGIAHVLYLSLSFGITTYTHYYHNEWKQKTRPAALFLCFYFCVSMIFAQQIWSRFPENTDGFGIRAELKRAMITILSLCCYLIISIVLVLIFPKYKTCFAVSRKFCNAICCFLFIYYSIFWVIKRFLKQQHSIIIIENVPFTKSMKQIKIYREFMSFLNQHFAVSRLLFLTEVVSMFRLIVLEIAAFLFLFE